MKNKINVEITTRKQRDNLIKELNNMTFENKLVKNWEELGKLDGWYIDTSSNLIDTREQRTISRNENIYHTKKQAESMLAYAQLTQLMAQANGEWEADWSNYDEVKYGIDREANKLKVCKCFQIFHPLSFKSGKIAKEFLELHEDLIKTFFQI